MENLNLTQAIKSPAHVEERLLDENRTNTSGTDATLPTSIGESESPVRYRVYKRRWFGLVQLVLLNIIVSWGVSMNDSFGTEKKRWLTRPQVAHLLPRLQYIGKLLFDHVECHQLAEHGISLRLCRRLAGNDIRPSERWTSPGLHQLLDPVARG